MATNAGKYGALSNEIGRVEVTWNTLAGQIGEPQFGMSWMECGGPPVAKPTRRGFGSTVIGGMVNMSLDSDAEIDYAPAGFRWRITCPADKIAGAAEATKARPAPRSIKATATGSKVSARPGLQHVLLDGGRIRRRRFASLVEASSRAAVR